MRNDTILVLADPHEPVLALLEKVRGEAEIVVGNSVESFESCANSAIGIFNWSGSLPLLRKVFGMCPNLRWVHSRSVGLERSLFPELVESPVVLTNGVGVFSGPLGEFVLAAILHFAKDLRRMMRNQIAGVWEPFDVVSVAGQTLGIVGYGDIGRAVAARVHPLGMTIHALKRHAAPPGQQDKLIDRVYTPDRRIEMLSLCDYVVVAAPLTEETRGMISEREFAAMKANTVVINVGRGPVIDEDAMIIALSTRRIKGAALDVFDEEPLPSDHPFYQLENVLLSPHCADHTSDWLENAVYLFIDQLERFLGGKPLLNVVRKELGY
jgi:phosphoglycerate dehydrogenase-like enzyme